MSYLTRRGFVILGASAAISALAGCSPETSTTSTGGARASAAGNSDEYASSSSSGDLRFMTGGQRGMYHEFCEKLVSHADAAGLSAQALISDGSKANLESLELGQAEFGLCQADVLAYARSGERSFGGTSLSSFSVVTALYDESVQIVTCDPDIKEVADLRDKYVSVGLERSGTYFSAWDVLGAHGITQDDITPYYLGFGDAASALAEGVIDAAFLTAGTPTMALSFLSDAKPIRFLEFDEERLSELEGSSPHYKRATVPANTYTAQADDAETLSVTAVLVASNLVPDETVYALLSNIYQTAAGPQSAADHEKYAELSIERGASVDVAPYHGGAVRFFAEKGIAVVTR